MFWSYPEMYSLILPLPHWFLAISRLAKLPECFTACNVIGVWVPKDVAWTQNCLLVWWDKCLHALPFIPLGWSHAASQAANSPFEEWGDLFPHNTGVWECCRPFSKPVAASLGLSENRVHQNHNFVLIVIFPCSDWINTQIQLKPRGHGQLCRTRWSIPPLAGTYSLHTDLWPQPMAPQVWARRNPPPKNWQPQ